MAVEIAPERTQYMESKQAEVVRLTEERNTLRENVRALYAQVTDLQQQDLAYNHGRNVAFLNAGHDKSKGNPYNPTTQANRHAAWERGHRDGIDIRVAHAIRELLGTPTPAQEGGQVDG